MPVLKKLWSLESTNSHIEFFRLCSFPYSLAHQNCSKRWEQCTSVCEKAGELAGCCKFSYFDYSISQLFYTAYSAVRYREEVQGHAD